MPKPYSIDLRKRVVEEVESGASRREAAEGYRLSPSVVVIWLQRFEETGSVAAKPSGGSTSALEKHAEFLLGLTAAQPDLMRHVASHNGELIADFCEIESGKRSDRTQLAAAIAAAKKAKATLIIAKLWTACQVRIDRADPASHRRVRTDRRQEARWFSIPKSSQPGPVHFDPAVRTT
jgi:hypothetical protein